jgi:predicted unusual protein kinase regulating ubiquinone biosynthesis (AarF/ABC1/UbiB family)
MARIGAMAGGVAIGTLAEGARRWWGGTPATAVGTLLSSANARQLARGLARMRGAAMKLGQLVSLEGDFSVPAEFADALAVLRAASDVMPPAQLHRVLGREYGRGWQKRFRDFGEKPIASASIGQVHRVVANDGRELALKIQFPGVAKSIGSDVDNLGTLLRMARVIPEGVDLKPLLSALKRQLEHETDYEQEAAALVRYRRLMAREDLFLVPAVHADLTTKRVLAMDYVDARPINELWEQTHSRRLREGIAHALQRLVLRELFEFRFMQTDPNFANYLYVPAEGKLVLLDFGSTIEIEDSLVGLYRRLVRAVESNDRASLREAALAFGWTTSNERADRVERLLDFILLCCEPLRHHGRYDFGTTDLVARARKASLSLAFERGRMGTPPPQSIFVHRKLAGTFLLCSRLGARVDTRALTAELVPANAGRG